ncbi:tetraspanin-8 [Larimichthys crocea]|uniref:tetraspanin-8 n=1 Tax=Larimichthys crocea TaxID=215358 RepID=UPI000901FEDC|nr:tetraspanin-8 [Larimichthys crocea]XP_027147676.1 tetraspanin-8 [Larimichthys crocea]
MFPCSVHQRCSRRRMPQVKPHLWYLLFGFCIFLVIVGGLVFVVALAQLFPSQDVAHGGSDFEGQTTSHIILYIHGSVTMAIGILGACGAHQKNLMVLNAFLVCTVVEVLLMLRAGVYAAEDRPKLEIVVEERWRSFLPLDQASDDVKKRAEALQTSLHCCGLFSSEDWEQNIPDSCLCNQEETTEDKCQSVSYRNFLFNLFWQKKSVFRQNCFPFIVDSARTNANVTLAAAFTGLALALLGLVLSSLMIYQINTCNGPNAAPLPVMFVDQPPAYQRL